MNEKLREHIEGLFKDAPRTKQVLEIKDEILQNTVDRYNDLIAEGKSEEEAFKISVAGIGDISHIIGSVMAPKAMSGYTAEQIEANKRQRSILLSIATMLYICCVVPLFICHNIGADDEMGVVFMFLMIAAATGLIIYRSGIKLHYDASGDTVVENFREWNHRNKEDKSRKSIVSSIVFPTAAVLYLCISFSTHAWNITWLIFPIAAAVLNIIYAVMDLKK